MLLAGGIFYFVFESSLWKAAGIIIGSLLIDVAIDMIIFDIEKYKGKIAGK